MYFASRVQAGRLLAAQLVKKYRYENCAVLALDDGGVVIGAQIATQLHCVITLLTSAEINLPREPTALAGITGSGAMAYNSHYSKGEIDEMVLEYRGFVEQEKLRQMHELNHLLTGYGTVTKDLLRAHNVIVVSEGITSAFQVELTYEYLKPIATEKIVYATPIASVQAVDRMHILADDIYCLDVIEDIQKPDHYYDQHDVPDHKKVIKIIEDIILKWR